LNRKIAIIGSYSKTKVGVTSEGEESTLTRRYTLAIIPEITEDELKRLSNYTDFIVIDFSQLRDIISDKEIEKLFKCFRVYSKGESFDISSSTILLTNGVKRSRLVNGLKKLGFRVYGD